MQGDLAARRFKNLLTKKSVEEYNFEHFTAGVLIEDARRTYQTPGICAGERAPDFELPQVGGGSIRLCNLRGRPVLLHFGSYT